MGTAEQKARDLLERIGVEDAQSFSAGDLVELANMIAANSAAVSIVRKMRADLTAVGWYENGLIGVPASGLRSYIDMLESALVPNVQGKGLATTDSDKGDEV